MRRITILAANDEVVGQIVAAVLPLTKEGIVIETFVGTPVEPPSEPKIRLEPPPPGALDKLRRKRGRPSKGETPKRRGTQAGPARLDIEATFKDGTQFTAKDVRALARKRGIDLKTYTNALHSASNGPRASVEIDRSTKPFSYRIIPMIERDSIPSPQQASKEAV